MNCIICGRWFANIIHDGACPTCSRVIKQLRLNMTANRLIELAQAEKDGRLVVLPHNDPLTLEELREMDGEPVWVCEPNGTNGVWGLVDLEYQMVRLHGGGLAIWENNDKSWLAYRRKPEEETNGNSN